VTDADVRELFWFLDDTLLARTGVREQYFWKARPGSYVVRVVDDQGRADSRNLDVALVQ
jgi:penicillin-binding protein 1C